MKGGKRKMRTKSDILYDGRLPFSDPKYKSIGPLWVEYMKLEVLVDIRDIFLSSLTPEALEDFNRRENL